MRKIGSCLLAILIGISPGLFAQEQQKYKLSILEDASTVKRVKGGRVSSQVVVKVTDENDRPMPAIAILFTIPQGSGGTFVTTGGLTAPATTNAAGIATGPFTANTSSTFSMSVTASTPGGPVTVSVPVNVPSALASLGSSAAAGGGGSHTGLIIGVLAGVGAAGAIAAKVLSGGKNNTPPTPQPSTISGQIGSATGGVFGPHN
jgi:hypothetical protein